MQLFCLGYFSVNMRTDAIIKRYHQTLVLNASSNGGDASRVGIFSAASSRGKRCSYYLVEFVFPPLIYPDARRVAPISACVSSSDKRYH